MGNNEILNELNNIESYSPTVPFSYDKYHSIIRNLVDQNSILYSDVALQDALITKLYELSLSNPFYNYRNISYDNWADSMIAEANNWTDRLNEIKQEIQVAGIRKKYSKV